MNKSPILADRYIVVDKTLATVLDRAVAYLIDAFIYVFFALVLVFSYRAFSEQVFDNNGHYAVYFIIFILYLLTPLIVERITNGRSIGKFILNIQVLSDNGELPSLLQSVMRRFLMVVDWGSLGVLVMVASSKNKRLGDMAAGTIVVKNPQINYFYDEEIVEAKKEYVVTYIQAEDLSLGQINLIESFLYTGVEKQSEKIDELANKVEKFLKIKSVNKTNEEFLQTIVRDYRHLVEVNE